MIPPRGCRNWRSLYSPSVSFSVKLPGTQRKKSEETYSVYYKADSGKRKSSHREGQKNSSRIFSFISQTEQNL